MLIRLAPFFGIPWVIALGEEFFFRGLLQQWITAWLHNDWTGLLLTSLLFGSLSNIHSGIPMTYWQSTYSPTTPLLWLADYSAKLTLLTVQSVRRLCLNVASDRSVI